MYTSMQNSSLICDNECDIKQMTCSKNDNVNGNIHFYSGLGTSIANCHGESSTST